ncbi:I78 family peptidase inhibitor [Azomonas macrocytogenes]|uniref:Peptidase inhibitor I78 family protein n=1 Tax=Azomonas macrocytogenes TaxID=69962 RepID=A0A839T599_AZOMA|nr:I78 family peptidase inhibitor [Azomonas macrocytogenes]MBB3103484.1 hypothetical protein [Azomonas macrocytogenes]
MTKHAAIGLLCLVTFVAGCSSTNSTNSSDTKQTTAASGKHDTCTAAAVEKLIGRTITVELADEARVQSGASLIQVMGPEDGLSMDYDPQRLNVDVDDNGKIQRINCG